MCKTVKTKSVEVPCVSFPVVESLPVDILEFFPTTSGDDKAVVVSGRVVANEGPEEVDDEGEAIDVSETRGLAKAASPVLSLLAEVADIIVLAEDGDKFAKLGPFVWS